MTPEEKALIKQKAQELFDEMWHEISHPCLHMVDIDFIAKQCALIAVAEIINEDELTLFWREVKKEIENF